jgi:SAM-dependent methyltransferase
LPEPGTCAVPEGSGAAPLQHTIIAQCPLCGRSDAPLYAAFPVMSWVRCSCGLIYMRSAADYGVPMPSAGAPNLHYSRRLRRRISKSRHQILDALNHTAPGPLLDVGCALGYTLQAARALGLEACGVEIDEPAVKFCRDQGFDVQVGTLTHMPFEANRFQIITMKHVLEHTPDPLTALAEVRRLLKPGGALFIAVPHAGYRKAVRDPQHAKFYQPTPTGAEGGHYIYYTPVTLGRLLERAGFELLQVHPHLIHRSLPAPPRLLQYVLAPFRWLAQQLATGLALRKEFWLVAVPRAEPPGAPDHSAS